MPQAQMVKMEAAADYLGTGAVEINEYEPVITDMVRRSSVALQRFKQIPATGQPHRYFEQTAIATGAFTTTGGQGSAAIAPTATGPTRVERPAFIKGIVAQSNVPLLDKMITQQQKRFDSVIAQDIEDIVNGVNITRAQAIWNGNDTSLSAPTTTQYMSLLSQITTQATCAAGTSIVDTIKGLVATLMSSQLYTVKPSAVYLNPILGDYLDRECKAQQITMNEMEVIAGVKAKSIFTQAGELPLIGDPFLAAATTTAYGFAAPPAGLKNYFAVIVMENEIEMPYVNPNDDPKPMLFQLGLTGNLSGQFVGIKFDTVIAKGATYAHAVLCVQRP